MEMCYSETDFENRVMLKLYMYQCIFFPDAFSSKRVSARAFTTLHCKECG